MSSFFWNIVESGTGLIFLSEHDGSSSILTIILFFANSKYFFRCDQTTCQHLLLVRSAASVCEGDFHV